jgi:MFS family permease
VISIGAVLGLAVGMAGGGWINEIWGWRTAFVVAGVPGLLVALLFRATVRGAIEGRGGTQGPRGTLVQDCRYLLSLPSMRWLLVAHVFALFYSIGKNSWEPTFIRRVYDMGSGASGTWYFLTTPLPSAFGLFLGGWLCDRWSRSDARAHLFVPALGMLGSIPFLLAFLLWPTHHLWELPFGLPRMPVAFAFSIVGSLLGAMYSAPFLAAVQALARLRMRASAAALFSLTGSGIGSGLGPLLVGELNVWLTPSYGEEAVRWALVWITISLVLASATCALSARSFRADVAAAKQG